MIKIKTSNISDTELHDAIIKKIYEITNTKPPITITSTGVKLTSLEIDDKKLSVSKKKELQSYVDTLQE